MHERKALLELFDNFIHSFIMYLYISINCETIASL